jgi:hypothetical protein
VRVVFDEFFEYNPAKQQQVALDKEIDLNTAGGTPLTFVIG